MFGFTYNGVHSSYFGLYYTMSPEDKWFNDPDYDVYDDDIDWRNGGYYYASKAKNRTFTIKCLFEEIDIATKQRIKQWLHRDSTGKLIFDDMPFVYWNVRPGKIPVGNWYWDSNEMHSGTVTITFNAYEPFGYLTRKYNTPSTQGDNAEDYCYIINGDEMPAAPSTSSTVFDVYNPGTESCGLTIALSGSTGNPIRFVNDANNTVCEFGSLPPAGTYVKIDGDTGYVMTYVSAASTYNGYAYHDKGIVRLEANRGYSDVAFNYQGVNGTTYTFDLIGVQVDKKMINATMTIDGLNDTIFTVTSISGPLNRLYCSRTGSGTPNDTGICSMKTVNHIAIQEYVNNAWTSPTTLSLSSIEIDYAPRLL